MDDSAWVESKIASYLYVPGNNILQWGKRRFCILKFDSPRLLLGAQGAPQGNSHLQRSSLPREPLVHQRISAHALWGDDSACQRKTTCELEYNLNTMQASDHVGIKPPRALLRHRVSRARKGVSRQEGSHHHRVLLLQGEQVLLVSKTPGHNSYPTEKGMLHAFLNYVLQLDPDIITGHSNVSLRQCVSARQVQEKQRALHLVERKFFDPIKHITTHSNQKGTRSSTVSPYRDASSWTPTRLTAAAQPQELQVGRHRQQFRFDGKLDMPYHMIRVKFRTPEGRCLCTACRTASSCSICSSSTARSSTCCRWAPSRDAAWTTSCRGAGHSHDHAMPTTARRAASSFPAATSAPRGSRAPSCCSQKGHLSGSRRLRGLCLAALHHAGGQHVLPRSSQRRDRAQRMERGRGRHHRAGRLGEQQVEDPHNPKNCSFVTSKVREQECCPTSSPICSRRGARSRR